MILLPCLLKITKKYNKDINTKKETNIINLEHLKITKIDTENQNFILSYKKYYKIYKLIFGKKYNRNKEKNIYIQINIIS